MKNFFDTKGQTIMTNQKLLAILRAFKALFDNLPKEHIDEDYADAADQLYNSYLEILHPILKTQYFTHGIAPDGEYMGIFETTAERDSFVETINQMAEERGSTADMTCKPITFEEFLRLSDGEEYELDNYSLAEDGAIEFIPHFAEP